MNPKSDLVRDDRKARRGARRQERNRTLKTQGAGAWELRGIRLLRVGDRCRELKLQERDRVAIDGGHADACDAGVNSGKTLRKSENPGVDGLGTLKRVPSARRWRTRQEPRFARIKAVGGRGKPMSYSAPTLTKTLKGRTTSRGEAW